MKNRVVSGAEIPSFERSPDTDLIYQRISKLQSGATLTYTELNKLINGNVQKEARHHLVSAARIAERDDRIVIRALENFGIIRLTDQQILEEETTRLRKKARGTFKRLANKLVTIEFAQLTNEQKVKYNAEQAMLGALIAFSRDSRVLRLEKYTTSEGGRPPPSVYSGVLRLFSKKD